jgi:hypothetical protein
MTRWRLLMRSIIGRGSPSRVGSTRMSEVKTPADICVDARLGLPSQNRALLAKLALCPDRVATVVSNKRIVEVLCFYEN